MMAVRGAIRQMFDADRVGLIISGTCPRAWRPVELAIDGHGSPHRSLTRGWLLALLAKYPVDAKPASARIFVLQV